MSVPLRTFGLLGLAVAMLGAGYLFAPAPGVASLPLPAPAQSPVAAAAPVATPVSVPAAKPPAALTANRPPVPYVTRGHSNYYPAPSIEVASATKPATTSDGKPAIDMGTFTANSLSPAAQQADGTPQTDGTQQASLTEPKSGGNDSMAKAAIENDGYKNVRNLVKDGDGWRGRAMRGRTEISIRVNADGSVSAD
jgi:hypothetical protein